MSWGVGDYMSANDDPDELYKKFRCALKFVITNSFDHLKLKYNIESFHSRRKRIGDIWSRLRDSSKIIIQHLENINLSDQNQKENMETIVESAEFLKFIDLSINSINDGDDLESSLENSGWNLDKVQLDHYMFRLNLLSFLIGLSFFVNLLTKIKSKKGHFRQI